MSQFAGTLSQHCHNIQAQHPKHNEGGFPLRNVLGYRGIYEFLTRCL